METYVETYVETCKTCNEAGSKPREPKEQQAATSNMTSQASNKKRQIRIACKESKDRPRTHGGAQPADREPGWRHQQPDYRGAQCPLKEPLKGLKT